MTLGPIVYILGAVTTLLCSALLLRAYVRSRTRLLLWSGLCFAGMTISNALLFVDLVLLPPTTDLYALRLVTAAVSMLILVYGLVWDSD